jgi:hypothetical protein
MKEIRAEVKAFLKGDTLGLAHLGDLPNNMEDARRVIIATQDLLEIERDKHRKATLHICELVAILDGMSETQHELMLMVNQHDAHIRQLNQVVEVTEKHGYHMRDEMRQSQQERDAVLTTIRLLNGQPAAASAAQAGYNAALPLPMMAMGHSNKDRI